MYLNVNEFKPLKSSTTGKRSMIPLITELLIKLSINYSAKFDFLSGSFLLYEVCPLW